MKKCPQCKSIYGDDTLSFCLQDGTPLSAAYDSEATLVLGADDSTVQRTNANYNPEIPTETRFGESRQTESSIRELPPNKTSPHLIYAGAGLIAVLAIVGGMVWLNVSSRSTENLSPTGTPSPKNVNIASTTTTPAPTPRNKDVSVDPRLPWTNTGIYVEQGEQIRITERGSIVWDPDLPAVSPDGTFPASNVQSPSDFPLPSAGCGSLVMRIGTTKYAVGSKSTVVARESGTIEFIVNDRLQSLSNNAGNFDASIEIGGTQQTAVPKRDDRIPTTRELQDTLLKEAQRIEDEAKRR